MLFTQFQNNRAEGDNMSKIENKNLKESYDFIVTDCGLRVACYNMPGYNAVHAVQSTEVLK